MEGGGWKMEDGGWREEDGRWRMEDGGCREEDGGWREEDGRRRIKLIKELRMEQTSLKYLRLRIQGNNLVIKQKNMETITDTKDSIVWHKACHVDDIPEDGGGCALIEGKQIAIFNFARRGEWFATDNECPHRQQMAVSRGMIGSQEGEPKVACPFHKKTFSLQTGRCLNDDTYRISTFPVMVQENQVYVGL